MRGSTSTLIVLLNNLVSAGRAERLPIVQVISDYFGVPAEKLWLQGRLL